MSRDNAPPLLATDLEGIILPEIWIAVAKKTGIDELKSTTRDVADYDELMQTRLAVLRHHGLTIHDIQSVIATMDLLPGAADFLLWARRIMPLIIITDSYYELINPFAAQLSYATAFAHNLIVDTDGTITGYRLRVQYSKRLALRSFRQLGFRTVAIGDSYNDIAMLREAHLGLLFNAPENVHDDYPQFATTTSYDELRESIRAYLKLPLPDRNTESGGIAQTHDN